MWSKGAKPRLVADLAAQYHSEPVVDLQIEPDVVIECTGVGKVGRDAALLAAPGGIIALTGFSQSERLVKSENGHNDQGACARKQGGIRDSKRRPPTLRSGGRGTCEG